VQKPECRVGAWSSAFPASARVEVKASPEPLPLLDSINPPPIKWRQSYVDKSVDDYMNEAQITGLLILKNGEVVAERYQYDRQPGMPMRSFSMAKSFTSLLIGIALDKGFIKSLDDRAADYWPEISKSAYGQTSIKNLLRMSSGVKFKELYTWTPDDDNWVWGKVLYDSSNFNKPQAIVDFLNERTTRETEQGTHFNYASIETEILGRVLRKATGRGIAELTEEWIWKPMGAENSAYWLYSTTDKAEAASGGFNASLRDYGRFGILLSNDGQRDGQTIIPHQYLLDATDIERQPRAFKPKIATQYMGYGYQIWLLPYRTRTFALQGIHGQTIFVQPASKIVMVQTAVYQYASGKLDNKPYLLRQALWEGVLKSLGGKVD
jgi:CubicO group peptidase (beta-lactamase class C family)